MVLWDARHSEAEIAYSAVGCVALRLRSPRRRVRVLFGPFHVRGRTRRDSERRSEDLRSRKARGRSRNERGRRDGESEREERFGEGSGKERRGGRDREM
eukprot:2456604-Rhodomonas_salina.1